MPAVPPSLKVAVPQEGLPAGVCAPLNYANRSKDTVAALAGWVKHKNAPNSKNTNRSFVRILLPPLRFEVVMVRRINRRL
jgi:hypothetical protein